MFYVGAVGTAVAGQGRALGTGHCPAVTSLGHENMFAQTNTGLKMAFLTNYIGFSNTLIFPGTLNKVSDLKAPVCLLLTRVSHIDDI